MIEKTHETQGAHIRFDIWACLLGVFVAGMLAILSVLCYTGYNAGMLDIGNMSQAIWSGTKGYPLEFTWVAGNFSRLALHTELFYFFLVPLYALFPSPKTLLIFQAALFALGALPAYRIAHRHFKSRGMARIFMLFYLLYPTAQTAVLFDFHGDTLAMPLLMLALDALDDRQWCWYFLWILMALSCKFYVAILVGVLGLLLSVVGVRQARFDQFNSSEEPKCAKIIEALWTSRVCRIGIVTMGLAGLWLIMTLGVIRPAFAPSESTPIQGDVFSYLRYYFGNLHKYLFETGIQRLGTFFIVFVPALWLGRHAFLWLLPAWAIALPALVSVGEVAAYDYRFHHYALPVPFFFIATVYGAVKLREKLKAASGFAPSRDLSWRKDVYFTLALIFLFFILLVDTPFNPRFWMNVPTWGIHHTQYGQLARDRFKDRWLAEYVPPDSPLASSSLMAPHIVNRRMIYMLRYSGISIAQRELFLENIEEVDYVVADALFDFAFRPEDSIVFGGVLYDLPGIVDTLKHPDFELLTSRDGLLLFSRELDSEQLLTQSVEVYTADESSKLTGIFGGMIALKRAEVEHVDGRRFRLTFEWLPMQALSDQSQLFAVTRLEGVDFSRYPHLPTLALHPTNTWQNGEYVREIFDIEMPADLPAGTYQMRTGWYDSSHLDAAFTDARSRIGEEVLIENILIP